MPPKLPIKIELPELVGVILAYQQANALGNADILVTLQGLM